ncbi:MAG TPA: NAD-glutamate dehydrogenase [Burkholderiales bacterium]|nr:NAD-glutamate dehydrogenase [Burkholderiales bacterium]
MPHALKEQKSSILSEVLALASERLPAAQVKEATLFIQEYFKQVDLEDLAERAPADVYGAALSHLSFARRFVSGAPKLRVYNPRLEEHGWESSHTVIEIVNDDMPFLVDSITVEVNRQGYTQHLTIHPLFSTQRDKDGALQQITPATKDGTLESLIHVEVDRQTDPAKLKALSDGLLAVLADVRAAVEDWKPMGERAKQIVLDLASPPAALPKEEVEEGKAFLHWVQDNHFTFLGARDYDLATQDGMDVLKIVPGSGLGILREPKLGGVSASFTDLPVELRGAVREPKLLVLTKSNSRATVHRPGYLDYIGVKRFDANGQVIGERRFIGLYTSSAYNATPQDIPILRQKISQVMNRAGFPRGSHLGKNLMTVLETYPRDELFQITEQELFDTAIGILHLGDRQRTRVFVRRDVFGRSYSCLIYVPRDRYNTELRVKLQEILKRVFKGTSVEFTPYLSESLLARIFMLVHTQPTAVATIDPRAIEQEIIHAMRRWEDDLHRSLIDEMGEEAANRISRTYANGFPASYREEVSPRMALHDIAVLEGLMPENSLGLSLYRPLEASADSLRLRLFRLGEPVPLSGSLPMLERMGVKVQDERSYAIEPEGKAPYYIHDFGMTHAVQGLEVEAIKKIFEEAFAKVWRGEIENDDFNRLVLRAQLSAREIIIVRAYCKYLKQTGFTFSQAYIEQTLDAHPGITRKLIELFKARFDTAQTQDREQRVAALEAEIKAALDKVANLDEDRILRRFLAVIKASLRTNYYQKGADGKPKSYLSFKLNPQLVPELPEPKPMFEIFVYSPRVEGIHLRGGKVARGGLRWSDRMEDFRTEVLGLVKAQMVKNSVIVPVGSKGGFVLKQSPVGGDRDAILKEGIACYQTFLRGLLDLTDNLVGGNVVPPKDVVRHDPDDPYLVVAADKGTASFSDIANAVSAEYGFWLGDAFASGGSVGYDHKKMGITAKGAWEAVKRHFREIGIDTQTTDFTAVGIGDMSGDVFGNGLLLSKHIRLVAAFDHRHIFLDPNPDTAASFVERERLFVLPRSSWADYDATKISQGGGVFPRGAKSIAISPEVKSALAISEDALTPVELMRAILKAPVDLLYNGGIGCYVKSASQTNAEVGDRANDAIRVNGRDLRCRVVAEGGNLGFTQLGRIEYALKGGRLNTDAIDNSAGVDCSDHEVNIKIMLGAIVADGELTEKQRNKLLAEMTDEVGGLVLQDNYYQTQSLSVTTLNAQRLLGSQARLMKHLEKVGRLNRAVEYLPTEEEIAERRTKGQGLTRPESAVLLAYSKMALYDELLTSQLLDDGYISSTLPEYFPRVLRERYAEPMSRHPLRREIIATVIVNGMINRVGSTFLNQLQEDTGAAAWEVVRGYILVRDVFGLNDVWQAIEALDNKVAADVQSRMFLGIGRVVTRAALWFLRRRREQYPIADVLQVFQPGVAAISTRLKHLLSPDDLKALSEAEKGLVDAGVPADLATRVASLDSLYSVLDIVEASMESGRSVELVAAVYFALIGRLDLRWLHAQINLLPMDTHWNALARAALRDDLGSQQRALAAAVLKLSPEGKDVEALLTQWEAHYSAPIARMREVLTDFRNVGQVDLAMLSVGLRELRALS